MSSFFSGLRRIAQAYWLLGLRTTRFQALLVLAVAGVAAPSAGAEKPTPLSIISDAVRDRGHTCKKPKNAQWERKQSRPDEEVWLIECENARYRVRFAGDAGPVVTPLN